MNAAEVEMVAKKSNIAHREAKIAAAEAKIAAAEAKIAAAEAKIAAAGEKLAAEEKAAKEAQISAKEAQISAKEAQISAKEAQMEAEREKRAAANKKMEAEKERIAFVEAKMIVYQIRLQADEAKNEAEIAKKAALTAKIAAEEAAEKIAAGEDRSRILSLHRQAPLSIFRPSGAFRRHHLQGHILHPLDRRAYPSHPYHRVEAHLHLEEPILYPRRRQPELLLNLPSPPPPPPTELALSSRSKVGVNTLVGTASVPGVIFIKKYVTPVWPVIILFLGVCFSIFLNDMIMNLVKRKRWGECCLDALSAMGGALVAGGVLLAIELLVGMLYPHMWLRILTGVVVTLLISVNALFWLIKMKGWRPIAIMAILVLGITIQNAFIDISESDVKVKGSPILSPAPSPGLPLISGASKLRLQVYLRAQTGQRGVVLGNTSGFVLPSVESQRKVALRPERDILKNLKRDKNEDAVKGIAVKNHKALWDKTLELRFLLQKAFSNSNRLPQNVSEQVASYMRDPSRMIKQMQQSRSTVAVFGTVPAESMEQIQEEIKLEGDPELVEDAEFYQQLLKEFFETIDPASSEAAFYAMKKFQTKKRKVVDRRASKCRKIRYNVHEKIVNFMAPRQAKIPPNTADLLKNLFGLKNKNNSV